MMVETIAVLASVSGICSAIGGGLAWYRSTAIKSYAAQDHFLRLERNQQTQIEYLKRLEARDRQTRKSLKYVYEWLGIPPYLGLDDE